MDVDIQFVSIAKRDDLGMDALIEGEIKIDTSEYFIHVNIFLERWHHGNPFRSS